MTDSAHRPLENIRIAFVQARWHADIVDRCRQSFIAALEDRADVGATVEVFDAVSYTHLTLPTIYSV